MDGLEEVAVEAAAKVVGVAGNLAVGVASELVAGVEEEVAHITTDDEKTHINECIEKNHEKLEG